MTWDTCDAFTCWRDARLGELEDMLETIQAIARHVVRGRQEESYRVAIDLETRLHEFQERAAPRLPDGTIPWFEDEEPPRAG